jgi:hypothetical protein
MDMEGGGCKLFEGMIPAFIGRKRKEPEKP